MTLSGNPALVDSLFDQPPFDGLYLLKHWLNQATAAEVPEPNAMVLATVNAANRPSSRVVSAKSVDDTGLIFGTSAGSTKGEDLATNPMAGATFWWPKTLQQIHIKGKVEQLDEMNSDAWFSKRPIEAQAVSTVSRQSRPLDDENALRNLWQEVLAEPKTPLPRPKDWFAYRLVPTIIEFWIGSADRFHRRLVYERQEDAWRHFRLQP